MERWIIFKPGLVKRWAIRQLERLKAQPEPRRYLPSVYLHRFQRSDDDRHFHDHVGWSVSIVLRAGYWELTPDVSLEGRRRNPKLVAVCGRVWRWRGPGSFTFRRADQPHIIALGKVITRAEDGSTMFEDVTPRALHNKPIWSLWIRGPWRREWGFYTEEGWVTWEQYENRGPAKYQSKAPQAA